MRTIKFGYCVLLTGLSVTAGCAHDEALDPYFGDAVRQVEEGQIYDMNAALNPDPNPVMGGDPDRLNLAVEGHRKDVAAPSQVGQPITINVGGNSK